MIIILLTVGFLIILFSMDILGMQSNYLDRISRLVTLIAVSIGAVAIIYQAILISQGWNDNYPIIFILGVVIIGVFSILGWYFIREEYGLTKINYSPAWNESMTALLFCGILFFMEYFLPRALLIGIGLLFISYPFIIIIWGHPKVVPRVKPRKLVNPYKRVTFAHFLLDVVKATAIAGTILIVLYDGSVLLFPNGIPSENDDWIRNLASVALFGAFAMYIYWHNSEKLYGLFVVFVLYILTFIHFLLVISFALNTWWIIAPLNGFSLAGVYYFIEQKVYKSDNVRVMSGSYYILIIILVISAILMRSDIQMETVINYSRLVVSGIGIAYLLGYLRESPNNNNTNVDHKAIELN
ncbi:MAG: hypothetical protein ACTSWC_08050 [Promethearchaeota archaeon]